MNKPYLYILALTLTGANYAHKPTFRPLFQYGLKTPRLIALALLEKIARLIKPSAHVAIEQPPDLTTYKRFPVYADTMVGMLRLANLQSCLEYIKTHSIPGDVIETGVWRGGACAFMRACMDELDLFSRWLYACDSYEGLPPPVAEADAGDKHYQRVELAVSIDDVKKVFEVYGIPTNRVVFDKGFFADTLPKYRDDPDIKFSLIRLDGDMYESTMTALECLYGKLSAGGFCIIDDWHLPGARQAVEEYRLAHGITAPIEIIDDCAAYWQK